MSNLDDAIFRYENKADFHSSMASIFVDDNGVYSTEFSHHTDLANEYYQVSEWLKELKQLGLKEQKND